ncbi:hypothetical protein PIB30_083543 [Stylosanthes scabra]|uniref:Retrotransposon gag domain-containing protein n=1 Tax=Stylosanthes scabra TaxID=79078 RepID=A0ABU6SUJ6_9FABA|nr:hypothetical protein [Stylosanthes scabra]
MAQLSTSRKHHYMGGLDNESLYEAWERYKEMIRRCPINMYSDWLQLQTFYDSYQTLQGFYWILQPEVLYN